MKIEKLTIAMHPRTSWKAFDLGCRMALQWWTPLYGFLLMTTLPFFLLCFVLSPDYGIYFLWWLKPWFERGLLFIYSRQVFGEKVSINQAIRAWPSQIKPYWFASVTWQRFSVRRGFNMPVTQLESLTGEKRSSRLALLHKTRDNNNSWWMIVCVHWEFFITLGFLVALNMLMPEGYQWTLSDDFENDFLFILYNACWYLAMVIVAPLYIGGSFAAYLNRRILLEGWDIELGLKKIRNRWFTKGSIVAALFVGLLSYSMISPSNVFAQTSYQETDESALAVDKQTATSAKTLQKHEDIKMSVNEILSEPPFTNTEMSKSWRWKEGTWSGWNWDGWQWDDNETEEKEARDYSGVLAVFGAIATFAEVILWGLFIGILLAVLWLNRRHLKSFFNTTFTLNQKADKLDLPAFSRNFTSPNSLPEDIPDALEHLLAQQAYRQALSLLLVSSLTHLRDKHELVLTVSMTELECLRSIELNAEEQSYEFMRDLIHLWIDLAWAHVWPNSEVMVQLVARWKGLLVDVEAKATS